MILFDIFIEYNPGMLLNVTLWEDGATQFKSVYSYKNNDVKNVVSEQQANKIWSLRCNLILTDILYCSLPAILKEDPDVSLVLYQTLVSGKYAVLQDSSDTGYSVVYYGKDKITVSWLDSDLKTRRPISKGPARVIFYKGSTLMSTFFNIDYPDYSIENEFGALQYLQREYSHGRIDVEEYIQSMSVVKKWISLI